MAEAAVPSDSLFCFWAPCTNILTYLLTYCTTVGPPSLTCRPLRNVCFFSDKQLMCYFFFLCNKTLNINIVSLNDSYALFELI